MGLAIAAVLIAGFQLRPSGVLPSTGTLQIAITGSGAGVTMMVPPSSACHSKCNVTSVLVTVTSVEVHTSGIDNMTGEWTTVCADKVPMTIDLVQLQNVSRIICGASIKPQAITNVRLDVSSANATIGGVPTALTVPSGKLEIPISPFANVEAGKITIVLVQFQPHIVCTGNGSGFCKLTPVLHAMPQGPD
ncbi:MAG TPA: DUF4382 domain-containing protein [Candidatus Bathyarchaeia archaeon]|nr:DUF4382 domain-containing protein [Candidatus Bathyarchaeia archaeon]